MTIYTKVKTDNEQDNMRTSGGMLASVLSLLEGKIEVGMSTKDIARIAKDELLKLGGQPAFLGYQGFPDVICTSVNDEIVHGIPSETQVIKGGDIVSIDFGVNYKGMITDSALSMIAGTARKKSHEKLLQITEASLEAGLAILKDGVSVGSIGSEIQSVLEPANFGIVRDLVGHGVGHYVHEEPNIPNYGKANTGPKLEAGMTVAIEPMATLGTHKVKTDSDGWTIRTEDGSRSAHFEHTVLITNTGYEVLTARK